MCRHIVSAALALIAIGLLYAHPEVFSVQGGVVLAPVVVVPFVTLMEKVWQ